jgi:hypothetical protein
MKTFVLLALLCLAVTSQAFAGSATIPSRALAVTQIQKLTNWEDTFDTGTGTGSSTGLMRVESSPSRSGASREFVTGFTNSGGERYWVTFGEDTSSSNFVYDGWFYVAKPSSGIANIEMDLNQVMSNGQTVIYGFPVRRLFRHLGLHRKLRNTAELRRPVGPLKSKLQPTPVGDEHLASHSDSVFARRIWQSDLPSRVV